MKEHRWIPCRHSVMSKLSRCCALVLWPLIAAGILISCAYATCEGSIFRSGNTAQILCFLLVCVLACWISGLLFWFAICSFLMENRKYALDKSGIWVKDRKEQFYHWEDICEIIIAAYAASASLQNYDTIICICFNPKPAGFAKKILRNYIYGIAHQADFIIIDYTPEAEARIATQYRKKITDIRKIQLGPWSGF